MAQIDRALAGRHNIGHKDHHVSAQQSCRPATSKRFCIPTPTSRGFRETGPLIIERGKGVRVYDSDGKDYIEGMAGLWCTALGWGDDELVEAAAAQMRKLAFAHLFAGKSHDPAIELAEKLKEIAPFPVGKVFFGNSGSEANDTQIKLFWYLNNALGRPQEEENHLPRIKAYHGVTIAAASLTGLARQSPRFRSAAAGFRCTPAARIIIASREPARARQEFARGLPPSSKR